MAKKFDYNEFLQEWNEFNPNLHLTLKGEAPTKCKGDKTPIVCNCDICGGEYETIISNLYGAMKQNGKTKGCRICHKKQAKTGIDDLLTCKPKLAPYIIDKEEAAKLRVQSNKRIECQCPYCGYKKEYKVCNLVNYGFSCPICDDGVSVPNKFLRLVLLQIKCVNNLIFEYSSDWTDKRRYDAYFEFENNKYVVEIDGIQHKKGSKQWKTTAEEQNKNDEYKNNLAKQNNIIMIRIPCHKTDCQYMKDRIIDSKLSTLFDLSSIDWEECFNRCDSSLMVEVSNYYKAHKNMSIADMEKVFHISQPTIMNYLKRGTEIGLCEYSLEKAWKIRSVNYSKKWKERTNKDFKAIDEYGNVIGHYYTIDDCIKNLYCKYKNRIFSESGIRQALRSGAKYNNLNFVYCKLSLLDVYKNDSLIYNICDYYNNTPNIKMNILAEKFNVSLRRVKTYLLAGDTIGLCNYNNQNTKTTKECDINEYR